MDGATVLQSRHSLGKFWIELHSDLDKKEKQNIIPYLATFFILLRSAIVACAVCTEAPSCIKRALRWFVKSRVVVVLLVFSIRFWSFLNIGLRTFVRWENCFRFFKKIDTKKLNPKLKYFLRILRWNFPLVEGKPSPKRPVRWSHPKPGPCSPISSPLGLELRRDPRTTHRPWIGLRARRHSTTFHHSKEHLPMNKIFSFHIQNWNTEWQIQPIGWTPINMLLSPLKSPHSLGVGWSFFFNFQKNISRQEEL